MRPCLHAIALSASAGLCVSFNAQAGIVATGGSAVVAVPPADIRLDRWESETETRAWAEQSVTLLAPLDLDHVEIGLVNETGELVPGQAIIGTAIGSYMLRCDPIGGRLTTYAGFITFDEPILGLQIVRELLNDSDTLLGLPGIQYNKNEARGLEFGAESEDQFVISPDRLRLDFIYETSTWTDDIRIVTAVPTPATGLVMAFAATTLTRRRR